MLRFGIYAIFVFLFFIQYEQEVEGLTMPGNVHRLKTNGRRRDVLTGDEAHDARRRDTMMKDVLKDMRWLIEKLFDDEHGIQHPFAFAENTRQRYTLFLL